MKVKVNGSVRDLPEGARVNDLVASLGLRGGAVVELNLEIVPAAMFDRTILKEGDSVEIVRFVGGG